MASTGLSDPYDLTSEKIDEVVTRKSPGTYVLDKRNGSGSFAVNYVGRSDDDVNGRLKDWVNTKYKRFKFGYNSSPKEAFEKECNIWHDFGGDENIMDNEKHPQRPVGSDWQCPKCDVFKAERWW